MTQMISAFLGDLGQWWPWWLGAMMAATVWLVLGTLADIILRRRSSSLRHAVSVMVALGVPTLFFLPLWPRAETTTWRTLAAAWTEGRPGMDKKESRATESWPRTGSAPAASVRGMVHFPWQGCLIAVWAAGVVLGSTRLVVLMTRNPLAGYRVSDADDSRVLAQLRRECEWGGLQIPRLVLAEREAPMVFGLRSPTVVLPTSATEWPAEKLVSVLRHELAHIRRADLRWAMLTEWAVVLLWLHPLALGFRRRLVWLSEEACDDVVLQSGVPPVEYAEYLRSFLSVQSSASLVFAFSATSRSGWVPRMRRLLDPKMARHQVSSRQIAVLTLAACLCAAGGASLVGCSGVRPDGPAVTAYAGTYPWKVPEVKPGATHLRVQVRGFGLVVREADAAVLGFPEGFPVGRGQFLAPEKGWQLFHNRRKGSDLLFSDSESIRAGQATHMEFKDGLGQPPEMSVPNPQTGRMEIRKTYSPGAGAFLKLRAKPTDQSNRLDLSFDGTMVLHHDWMAFERFASDGSDLEVPTFQTFAGRFDGVFENGGYILFNAQPGPETVERSIPMLRELPWVGPLFRVSRSEKHVRLVAVQLIVDEAKDGARP